MANIKQTVKLGVFTPVSYTHLFLVAYLERKGRKAVRGVIRSGTEIFADVERSTFVMVAPVSYTHLSYRYKKQEYIHNGQGTRPFFWRAPTDNDYGAKLPVRLKAWKEACLLYTSRCV